MGWNFDPSILEGLMPRIPKILYIATSSVLALNVACGLLFCLFEQVSVQSSAGGPAPQPSDELVTHLNQAWSQADWDWYYHFSQGSAVIPYDIFLNLGIADSEELFRSDANSERYGLIPDAANPDSNPDGLPIGLSKTIITEERWKGEDAGEYVGLTCAACHEGQLNYKGKHVRIDGGVGNMFDMMGYVFALDSAMQATLNDGTKFDRLVTRLGASDADAKDKLRKRFESQAAKVHEYRSRNLVTPTIWGPARMDAIAMIVNRLTATEPDICQLVLGMSPGLLDISDVKLVKKFHPEEWRAYCEFHCGPPEEHSFFEDGNQYT